MRVLAGVVLFLVSGPLRAQEVSPIIDMHLHAHTLSMYGAPPPAVCTNDQEILFPGLDTLAIECVSSRCSVNLGPLVTTRPPLDKGM